MASAFCMEAIYYFSDLDRVVDGGELLINTPVMPVLRSTVTLSVSMRVTTSPSFNAVGRSEG